MTQPPFGYSDTPIIPAQTWRVHDGTRPQPPIVGAPAGGPPSDAVILFDGRDLSGWRSVATGGPAGWAVRDGYAEVVATTGDIQTVAEFGDCQLHVEFATPVDVVGDSQGRGNSGIFLMGRYEIQVLDGYQNPTYADGMTGAIYGQYPPLANACRPPGEWQSYDIIWIAPRFAADGSLVSAATCSVTLNGVVLHYHRALIGPTAHRRVDPWVAHPPIGPLRLQDHRNPTRFRNIWYRSLDGWNGSAR